MIGEHGAIRNMSDQDRDYLMKTVNEMANRGLRTLTIAYKSYNGSITD